MTGRGCGDTVYSGRGGYLVCCFGDCQSGGVLYGPGTVAVAAGEGFIREFWRAFLMRVYHSVCPGCGKDVKRGYGEMGEGLVHKSGCRCRMELALGDWLVIGLVVLSGLVLAVG